MAALVSLIAACGPATAATSSITYAPDLTGKSSPTGFVLWFNSVLRPAVSPLVATTVCITEQLVTVRRGAVIETIPVPNATMSFKPWESVASTSFGSSWVTSIPTTQASSAKFMSGAAEPFPTGLPRDITSISWSGRFESDALLGMSVLWQWGAGAYSLFDDDYAALGVAAGDRLEPNIAGTPVNFKAYVIARPGEASPYTGARSPASSVVAENTGQCGGIY